jgi:hypothetical protein
MFLAMKTDALILHLSCDLKAAPRHAVESRVAIGLAIGAAVSLLLVFLVLGVRPDIASAVCGLSFWTKLLYVVPLGIGGSVATANLARPDAGRFHWSVILVFPIIVLTSAVMIQMPHVSADWRSQFWLGMSWRECTWRIALLAIPIYSGLVWSYAKLAPARPVEAGAAAGLTAGAIAAAIYALHCGETSMGFVSIWYSLGIAFATFVGALAGTRLLCW